MQAKPDSHCSPPQAGAQHPQESRVHPMGWGLGRQTHPGSILPSPSFPSSTCRAWSCRVWGTPGAAGSQLCPLPAPCAPQPNAGHGNRAELGSVQAQPSPAGPWGVVSPAWGANPSTAAPELLLQKESSRSSQTQCFGKTFACILLLLTILLLGKPVGP